jgi:class 3 adenylate cyclase
MRQAFFDQAAGDPQQEHPAEWPETLSRHHALLRQAIECHGGYLYHIRGDQFCAAFHTAGDALWLVGSLLRRARSSMPA